MNAPTELNITAQMLWQNKVTDPCSMPFKEALLANEKLLGQIHQLALTCLASLWTGYKIIYAGNGGSFADAQHLSAELSSRFLFDPAP